MPNELSELEEVAAQKFAEALETKDGKERVEDALLLTHSMHSFLIKEQKLDPENGFAKFMEKAFNYLYDIPEPPQGQPSLKERYEQRKREGKIK